jgi:hypothetical protein
MFPERVSVRGPAEALAARPGTVSRSRSALFFFIAVPFASGAAMKMRKKPLPHRRKE